MSMQSRQQLKKAVLQLWIGCWHGRLADISISAEMCSLAQVPLCERCISWSLSLCLSICSFYIPQSTAEADEDVISRV